MSKWQFSSKTFDFRLFKWLKLNFWKKKIVFFFFGFVNQVKNDRRVKNGHLPSVTIRRVNPKHSAYHKTTKKKTYGHVSGAKPDTFFPQKKMGTVHATRGRFFHCQPKKKQKSVLRNANGSAAPVVARYVRDWIGHHQAQVEDHKTSDGVIGIYPSN